MLVLRSVLTSHSMATHSHLVVYRATQKKGVRGNALHQNKTVLLRPPLCLPKQNRGLGNWGPLLVLRSVLTSHSMATHSLLVIYRATKKKGFVALHFGKTKQPFFCLHALLPKKVGFGGPLQILRSVLTSHLHATYSFLVIYSATKKPSSDAFVLASRSPTGWFPLEHHPMYQTDNK